VVQPTDAPTIEPLAWHAVLCPACSWLYTGLWLTQLYQRGTIVFRASPGVYVSPVLHYMLGLMALCQSIDIIPGAKYYTIVFRLAF
jgi:hypothetical protein